MEITSGTIFLTFAVFSDHIGLISCTEPPEVTLAFLFPGYEQSGILPPITIVPNPTVTNNPHFQRVGPHIMSETHHDFAARANIIFAYRGFDTYYNFKIGDFVQPLYKLFPTLGHKKRWVFDTSCNDWMSLEASEFEKLRFGLIWNLVKAQQEIASTYRLTARRSNEEDAQAHNYAYSQANHRMEVLQSSQADHIRSSTKAVDDTLKNFFKRRYKEMYKDAFSEYTHRHG